MLYQRELSDKNLSGIFYAIYYSFFRNTKIIIKDTSANKASSPSIFKISVTFLYTSPTNGVVGPKIIPSNRETATKGNNNFNNLLKKAVSLIRELLRFILKKLERV